MRCDGPSVQLNNTCYCANGFSGAQCELASPIAYYLLGHTLVAWWLLACCWPDDE